MTSFAHFIPTIALLLMSSACSLVVGADPFPVSEEEETTGANDARVFDQSLDLPATALPSDGNASASQAPAMEPMVSPTEVNDSNDSSTAPPTDVFELPQGGGDGDTIADELVTQLEGGVETAAGSSSGDLAEGDSIGGDTDSEFEAVAGAQSAGRDEAPNPGGED